jgi:hypothetical protein
MQGTPVRVVLSRGHNNDAGTFNLAEVGDTLKKLNITGLAGTQAAR